MRRIRELDGLRAGAILLVLGCHFEGFSQLAWKIPEFGWIGVEIFFALSGYLITTILLGLRGRSTPYKTFYSRRLIRILPPYVVVVLIIFADGIHHHWLTTRMVEIQALFLQAYTLQMRLFLTDVVHHPLWHITHLPSLLASAHHLPAADPGVSPSPRSALIIFWSLSVEEYFYLLWAPIVLRFSKSTVLTIGGAICILEMLLRWMFGSQDAYFSLAYRFDSLIYGAFLALLLDHWRSRAAPRSPAAILSAAFLTSAAGLAVILFAIHPLLGREIRESPLILVFGLPLFSIAASAAVGLFVLRANSAWWPARLLRTAPLQFVGTVSYTMYLVHILAYSTINGLMVHLSLPPHAFLQALLAAALTIALAQLSWRFLESPMLQWKDRRFPNAPHPPEPAISWVAPDPR